MKRPLKLNLSLQYPKNTPFSKHPLKVSYPYFVTLYVYQDPVLWYRSRLVGSQDVKLVMVLASLFLSTVFHIPTIVSPNLSNFSLTSTTIS